MGKEEVLNQDRVCQATDLNVKLAPRGALEHQVNRCDAGAEGQHGRLAGHAVRAVLNDVVPKPGLESVHDVAIAGIEQVIASAAAQGDDSGFKTVALGAGIATEDVDVRWIAWHDGSSQPDLLQLHVQGTGESLTWGRAQGDALASNYDDSTLVIDRITFAGGATWDLAEILQRANTGTGGADILIGESAADTLSGGSGNDVVKGMSGGDDLSGGAGDDTLIGGFGDDRVVGGTGNDRIDGGAGTNVAV